MMNTCIHTSIHTCTHTCMCVCICVCMYACMHVSIHVCMNACMRVVHAGACDMAGTGCMHNACSVYHRLYAVLDTLCSGRTALTSTAHTYVHVYIHTYILIISMYVSGMQKVDARLAVTARGSVESSHGAHGTRPQIFERHQSGDTVPAHNHVHQMRGAQMCMPCFSEEKAQQLPRIGRTSPSEWRHSICSSSGQDI